MSRKIFIPFAIFFAATAIFHLVGIFYPVNDAPAWRHALFVFINLFCAWGVIKRPWYFIFIFAVLLGQQLYSHGSDLISMWLQQHKVDWMSVGVLIMFPLVFGLLLVDQIKTQKSKAV